MKSMKGAGYGYIEVYVEKESPWKQPIMYVINNNNRTCKVNYSFLLPSNHAGRRKTKFLSSEVGSLDFRWKPPPYVMYFL